MSRPGPSAPRNLTLTEELEKLEQSITLTLQEIDHNFSKAHRIVTTSILPLVEQYGEHSRSVWEATKFWKQFFEASANVSLSGYEDLAGADENSAITGDESTIHNQTADYTPRRRSAGDHDVSIATDQSSAMYHGDDTHQEESTLGGDDDDDLTGSTPRPPATKTLSARPQFAGLSSPYEIMKREYDNERRTAAGGAKTPDEPPPDEEEEEDTELLFQQHTARLPNMSMNPRASLDASGLGYDDEEDDEFDPRTGRVNKTNNKDPLLHRMLDKNYRIAATPHKGGAATGISPIKWKVDKLATTPAGKGKDTHRQARPIWEDSPTSSPEMAVPQLRSAAFMSPARAAYKAKGKGKASAAAPVVTGPRTPGVSVQTPATGRKTKDVFANAGKQQGAASSRYDDEITWDSDSDGFGGMSPPKTIQFAMPPSKLLQTPAREASKRIVDNILLTAGEDLDDPSEYSPTVVKMNQDILDDTF